MVYALGLLLYGSLFITAVLSTLARAVRYRRENWRMPRLLVRDTSLLLGHGMSILVALLIRFIGQPADFYIDSTRPWFIEGLILTPAIVGISVYVYYELFVIERYSPPQSADMTMSYSPPDTSASDVTYTMSTQDDQPEAS